MKFSILFVLSKRNQIKIFTLYGMTHAILKKNNFDLAWKTSLNIIGNLASCEIVLYVKFKETQFELTKLVLPDFNVNFLSYLSVWSKLESLLSTVNFA